MRARVLKGARTFMVKVKEHRGETLNENADTQAESARQLPSEHRQWTTRTQTMTYEWRDNDDVKHVTVILTMKSYLEGEDQIRSQLIGTTRFCMF